MGLIRTLASLFEILTVLGAIIGGFVVFSGLLPGNSAIQTAAASATGVAFAAIPYAIAGSFHRMASRSAQMTLLELYEQ